jgi:hypothetical protein
MIRCRDTKIGNDTEFTKGPIVQALRETMVPPGEEGAHVQVNNNLT